MKYPNVKEIVLGDQLNVPEVQISYSRTVDSLSSLPQSKNDADGFVTAIDKLLSDKTPQNKKSVEKLAATFGITDKTHVKELTELAIVKRARQLAHSGGTIKDRFDKIVDLYNSQVNLSHRTSQSILLQQYSTPAPISYLAGVFCGIDSSEPSKIFFEPSAGNGLLTIAGYPSSFIVNEIDSFRNQNLQIQKFKKVTQQDATKPFAEYYRQFDAILTNPPFGISEQEILYDTFRIVSLEHVMALRALDCMKDYGRAAIIIGGHTRWDDKGRIQAGKNRIFFNYLYSRYNVLDVIMIDGHKLYSRQGTAFDVRLILIDGRKETPSGNAPLFNLQQDVEVKTFDELFNRVMDAKEATYKSISLGSKYLTVYKKYASIKPAYPDSILLLEEGFEYFIFGSDAEKLLREIDFTGAGEVEYQGEKIKMIRFPATSLQTYVAKIIKAGYMHRAVGQFENSKSYDMKLIELEAEALQLELQLLKTNFENGLGAIIPSNINNNNYELYLHFRNRYREYFKILVVIKKVLTGEYETFDQDAERLIYMFSLPLTLFSIIKGKKVYGMTFNEKKLLEIKNQLYHAGYVIAIIEDTETEETNRSEHDLSGVNYLYKDGSGNDEKMFKEWSRLKKSYPDTIILLEEATTFQTFDYDAYIVYNVRKNYDFKHKNPDFYVKALNCYGFPYFAQQGILREDRPLIEQLLLEAGYKPLFIENEKAHYKWPTRKELEQYELEKGQAHNAKDKANYRVWVRNKNHGTKNVLFIKQGARLYTTWEGDAEIARQVIDNLNFYDKKSIRDLFGKVIQGISARSTNLKHYVDVFHKKGYTIVFLNENNDGKGFDYSVDVTDYIDEDGSVRHWRMFEHYKMLKGQNPNKLILFETPGTYTTFEGDAETLARVCKIRYIKSTGTEYSLMAGVSKETWKERLSLLTNAGYEVMIIENSRGAEDLGAVYQPASEACIKLNTQVPDSMAFETHSFLQLIKQEVGGDIDNFVRHRLGYPTKAALCKVLSAEQIDAVAVAIYNIEARGQGMIIGDQTGIGKGRIAAAMIRYGVLQGKTPVFLTEKANLFSDIYRDLSAIGSGHLKPFIVNSREPKSDIKDEDGNVVYQAPPPTEQNSIFESRQVPAKYDFVVATYTQFNSAEKKPVKPNFLRAIAEDNILILDEAHNSSGSSNTGEFMQGAIRHTRGVLFLSATFAKRPDNLPIYAMKTAIADCNMTRDDLVDAITKGGVALQEVLSSQLVAEGQMIRRERSYEGIEVNYITLDDKAPEHRAIADNITEILRDIIAFQTTYVDKEVKDLDEIAVAESKEVEIREGTKQAGVDNIPYFSKVFNVINQMLFSLKAEAVAEKAIARLREGKKPVIAFASTMGSFIETMESDTGMPVGDGDTIDAEFSEVLRRGLQGIMRYTEIGIDGKSEYKQFQITDFPPDAQLEYQRISEKIESVSTGITISPIDIVIRKIKQAGYTVAEVTGRKFELQFDKHERKALVLARKRINTNDAFRMFNNNEVDVLMINQSGSTGASAHAIPTAKVPKDEVNQRVMIVLQAELDISTEVQKRGRINRTGQILKPIYDYVSSAIPAEKRLMMMLQKKLKSLDANTTSNQKQSAKILDVPDFLNKFGDKIVQEYLADNPEVNKLLDDPLYMEDSGSDSGSKTPIEDAAMKVSGRVAVLSTQMQDEFYTDISERYNDYVDYLKQIGEYDLEVEAMNLEAETISAKVFKMGKGTDSAFGEDSTLETVKVNVLKKPFSKIELENLLNESLKGENPQKLQQEFLQEYTSEIQNKLRELTSEVDTKYDQLIRDIPGERQIKKLEGDRDAWNQAVSERTKELEDARVAMHIKNEKTFENRSSALKKALNYFYIGRYVNYPVKTFGTDSEIVPAVFLGYLIDRKKKNPYAPSAIKLRFAIANSSKYLAIPASYSQDIMSIIGASVDLKEVDIPTLLNGWDNYIQKRSADRATRHIITGNLLQAFSDQVGKLVSYTTIDGQVKKGILMPEHWDPVEQLQDKVIVPILKALPIIRSLVSGHHIVTNDGLSIFRTGDYYKLIVSASRSKGGDIYLDKDILSLVEKNNFEKTSDKMVAMLGDGKISELVEVLQNNHSCSMTIQSYQLKEINKEAIRSSNRNRIELPPPEEAPPVNNSMAKIRILELEAEALELELLLLAA
ncbi:strawberry notch C-terminal domain-containing protein [Longitalea luteola]|uniref:strawberry notch C-terminal domain-containing protein n=1 Tax=Longitalea luteola TaxID=2812563 RepID=UPI001A97034F|nr:strawberry notch C-terminal domain-containing protein [Longitalea luteola]